MKKIILTALLIVFCAPSIAQDYYIVEADQALAGKYRQMIDMEKWLDKEKQKSETEVAASKDYEDAMKRYEEDLRRAAQWAAFNASLSNSLLSFTNQYQQHQALQLQQSKALRQYQSQQKTSYSSRNYTSTNYYNNAPKSNNGYPILDPYANSSYWNNRK